MGRHACTCHATAFPLCYIGHGLGIHALVPNERDIEWVGHSMNAQSCMGFFVNNTAEWKYPGVLGLGLSPFNQGLYEKKEKGKSRYTISHGSKLWKCNIPISVSHFLSTTIHITPLAGTVTIMMPDASTVTILVAVPEIDFSLKVGGVNVLGAQSSQKNPWYSQAEDLRLEQ